MKKRTRDDKLNDGQMYMGFELNGITHKPLTAASMKFLERINSPIYTSDYAGYSEMDVILEYLYATSHTFPELVKAIENWDIVQFEYADQFSVRDITDPKIVDCILRDIQNQNAANVEVRVDVNDEKKNVTNAIG